MLKVFVINVLLITSVFSFNSFFAAHAASSTCSNGLPGVPLLYKGSQSQVMPGFYAPLFDPNNASTFPIACSPDIVCQVRRMLGLECENSQSSFEPTMCPAKFYCPNATTKLPCPEGYYCRFGRAEPLKCPSLSSCAAGSERPQYLGSLIFMGVLLLSFIATSVWYHRCRSTTAAASDSKVSSMKADEKQMALTKGIARARIETTAPPSSTTTQKQQSKSFFDFRNLSVSVRAATGEDGVPLQILNNISGKIERGCVTSIMGASGSGKTTLFRALLRQLDPATYIVTGENRIDGGAAATESSSDFDQIKAGLAFVPQDESSLLHSELSIADNVYYASELALPRNWAAAERDEFREIILSLLGLSNGKHSIVGRPGANDGPRISGGMRKRAAIAAQLSGAPAALFLDEPTSGLSSTASLLLLRVLKQLAICAQIPIVCVVHQPRAEIFEELDHLLILSKGGVVYEGPAAHAVPVFSEYIPAIKDDENPADVLIDAVAKHGAEMSQRWMMSGTHSSSLRARLQRAIQEAEAEKNFDADFINRRDSSLKFEAALDFSASNSSFQPNSTLRQASFLRQVYLQHARACQKLMCSFAGLLIEGLCLLVTGILLAQGFGSPFESVFKGEYQRISPLFGYELLPQLISYTVFSTGLAGAVAGTGYFGGERKILFRSEAAAGLSSLAFFLGGFLAAFYRIFFVAVLFATMQHFFGLFPFDFWAYFGSTLLLYLNCNLIGVITSLLMDQSYATIVAPTAGLFYGVLNGAIAAFPYGLKVLSYGFWWSQILFIEWNTPLEANMDVRYDAFGYGRDDKNVSYVALILMVIVYSAISYGLIVFMNRTKSAGSTAASTSAVPPASSPIAVQQQQKQEELSKQNTHTHVPFPQPTTSSTTTSATTKNDDDTNKN